MFRRRFRMRKNVFTRIVNQLSESDVYFQQRSDAIGRLGASPLQKCTAAIRMLAYGTSANAVDEYLKIASSTAREGLAHFVEGVVAQFGPEYLRRANTMDTERLLRESYARGFPGMMGSIDCMHWEWKNCSRAWKGMYQGRSKTAMVILEVVASQDLWIWHAFFGTPGSCNDINVLQRSPVFSDICEGKAPEVTFNVNGNTYNMGYYLTDGINPKWATFIPAIKHPQTGKHKLFTKKQESYRKDVERAFGVLQARFTIIRQPSLAWSTEILWKIVMACIIMHNMIVEDERDGYLHYDATEFINDQPQNVAESSTSNNNQPFTVRSGRLDRLNLNGYMENRNNVRDRETHIALKNDLVEHIWGRFGNE
ncbi:putative nuclease HARBI1 [Chenopodium quinoa]|uniref:putative nuclease HARBI1 n=1 Tax=Chenopodium quinoa TaxID=63459 RepID=UPI000B799759|nr:putative nuclease HARBI1 [Chenopodium quinoa]